MQPRWEHDEEVWDAVTGQDWSLPDRYDLPLAPTDDLLESYANRAWFLYHRSAEAVRRRRPRGWVKEWRDRQLKGWFSLWQRTDGSWRDMLGPSVASAPGLDHLRPGDCVLARAIPGPHGVELLAASSDVLCSAEGEALARAGHGDVLEVWQERREVVLAPQAVYEHHFLHHGGSLEALKSQRPEWEYRLKGERLTIRQVVPHPLDPWDDPILEEFEERCEHLGTVYVGPATRHTVPKNAVLVIEAAEAVLRFPARFRFRQLRKALDCLKPQMFDEDSWFRLSLGRWVMPDDCWDFDETCVADTSWLNETLMEGSLFFLDDLTLRIAGVEPVVPGEPLPWFVDLEDVNARLRRAFFPAWVK